MAGSNGGMAAPLGVALYPVCTLAGNTGLFYFFDTTNYNDPLSPSYYTWKQEDIIAGRMPTCNRVIISYRDLGVANITVTLSGMVGQTDSNNACTPSLMVRPLTIGTTNATGLICTVNFGISLSAANLQLRVDRAADAGPVSITKIRLEGRVEKTAYS